MNLFNLSYSKLQTLILIVMLFSSVLIQGSGNLDKTKIGIFEGLNLDYDIEYTDRTYRNEPVDEPETKSSEAVTIQQIDYELGSVLIEVTNSQSVFPWIYNDTLFTFDNSYFVHTDWDFWKDNVSEIISKLEDDSNSNDVVKGEIINKNDLFGYNLNVYAEIDTFGRITKVTTIDEIRYDKSLGVLTYSYNKRIEEGPNGLTTFVESKKSLTTDLDNSPSLDTRGVFKFLFIISFLLLVGIFLWRRYIKDKYSKKG